MIPKLLPDLITCLARARFLRSEVHTTPIFPHGDFHSCSIVLGSPNTLLWNLALGIDHVLPVAKSETIDIICHGLETAGKFSPPPYRDRLSKVDFVTPRKALTKLGRPFWRHHYPANANFIGPRPLSPSRFSSSLTQISSLKLED